MSKKPDAKEVFQKVAELRTRAQAAPSEAEALEMFNEALELLREQYVSRLTAIDRALRGITEDGQ